MSSRLSRAIGIFEREYARLYYWANTLVDTWSAAQVAYAGFSKPFYLACSGQHSPRGAVQSVYFAAEGPLRRAVEIRGGYLPAGSWWRTQWPSLAEALELSQLYCTLVYVARTDGWTLRERAACMTALRMYRPNVGVPLWDVLDSPDAAVIKDTLASFAAVLSPMRPQDPEAAARAREVWDREQYRLVKTYNQREHLEGGADSVEEQQADHPDLSRPPDGDDHLAGLWCVRQHQPEHLLGRTDESAAY